jgi:hypothetical protein
VEPLDDDNLSPVLWSYAAVADLSINKSKIMDYYHEEKTKVAKETWGI